MVIRTQKRRIYSGKIIEDIFHKTLKHCAFAYNKGLEYELYHNRIAQLYGAKWRPNDKFFNQILKMLKKEYPFLKETESTCLQESLQRLRKAFDRFFNKKGRFPQFKKQKRNPATSFTLKNNKYYDKKGNKLYTLRMLSEKELRLNKIGKITLKDKRKVTGHIKRTTIKIENGRWFACINQEINSTKHCSKTGKRVGIDMGLKNHMIFSNRKVISKPELEKINKKIHDYQKKLSRCKKDGANRKKIRQKLNKWQNKKNDVINDFHHKISTQIVEDYDFIAMETLDIKNMKKNSKFSNGIQEAGWYKVKQKIKYKAHDNGKKLKEVDQWFPSSKKCSFCGHVLKELELHTRHWIYPKCHFSHDRDVNTANNILNEALRTEGAPVECLVDFPYFINKIEIKHVTT